MVFKVASYVQYSFRFGMYRKITHAMEIMKTPSTNA